jgi:hypothetical protein
MQKEVSPIPGREIIGSFLVSKGKAIEEKIDGRLFAPIIAEEKKADHKTNRVGREVVQWKLIFAREGGEEGMDWEMEASPELFNEPGDVIRRRIVGMIPRGSGDQ